jgi:dipeptidyl aminopeptidase/acylaminoacyl peptidase
LDFCRVDVNYRGSSGYGREYIERLSGNWGVVDVQDCITAAQTLSSPPYDLIDKRRVVIRGGSAGGFTVLSVLSSKMMMMASDVKFAGATSIYGVSDLGKLYESMMSKFVSKYIAKLVGGTPEEVPDVYKARSPIHRADNIVSALLVSFTFKIIKVSAFSFFIFTNNNFLNSFLNFFKIFIGLARRD